MGINVTSFASKSFEKQQKKQEEILLKIGFTSNEIHIFNPDKLNKEFFTFQPNACEKNKFGWYSFKPFFLGMVLKDLNEGDILLFLDVNDKPLLGIKDYIRNQFIKKKFIDILSCETNYQNFKYLSKFHKSNLSIPLLIDSFFACQPETGALAIRNSPKSRSIIRIWFELTLINSYKLNNFKYEDYPSRPCQETMFILSRIYRTIKFESWLKFKIGGKGMRAFIDFEALRD